jgi:hypothetical protein
MNGPDLSDVWHLDHLTKPGRQKKFEQGEKLDFSIKNSVNLDHPKQLNQLLSHNHTTHHPYNSSWKSSLISFSKLRPIGP